MNKNKKIYEKREEMYDKSCFGIKRPIRIENQGLEMQFSTFTKGMLMFCKRMEILWKCLYGMIKKE